MELYILNVFRVLALVSSLFTVADAGWHVSRMNMERASLSIYLRVCSARFMVGSEVLIVGEK